MHDSHPFLAEHRTLTRRYFLQLGMAGLAAGNLVSRGVVLGADEPEQPNAKLVKFATYFTPDADFDDVSRGKPLPHSLPDEKKTEVGMTRDTWKLEIISDPDNPARIRKPMTIKDGNAFDFAALMKLAETKAVRFPKIMTCLNLGCPLGMGIWEGVPLRELLWLVEPRENLRRVFFYGYHNDEPEQMFRSSLPVSRVLEDYYDMPPVIACYKLNGEWLSSERGGPVRIVVPESYGFKNIKWLSHLVLTNLFHANDTYADQNNDVDSPLKTFGATLVVPDDIKAGEKIPLSGYAQVGIGGLSKVQILIVPDSQKAPTGDPFFTSAQWQDVEILPPPDNWGGGLADGKVPLPTHGFDSATGKPLMWPMRFCAAHWAGVHAGLSAGKYTLRTRTIDAHGHAQPMPRPFRKLGHTAIEQVNITVT